MNISGFVNTFLHPYIWFVLEAFLMSWLITASIIDLHCRKVSNYLTIPAIIGAFGGRLGACLILSGIMPLKEAANIVFPVEYLFRLAIITVGLGFFFKETRLGGADFKILLALSIINPNLIFAAWVGALLFYAIVLVIRRKNPMRFAGIPGFALGIFIALLNEHLGFYLTEVTRGIKLLS